MKRLRCRIGIHDRIPVARSQEGTSRLTSGNLFHQVEGRVDSRYIVEECKHCHDRIFILHSSTYSRRATLYEIPRHLKFYNWNTNKEVTIWD